MGIFSARRFCFTIRLSDIFSKALRLRCQYRRCILCAVLVPAAILIAIAAVRGQQLSFIPNAVFFPNPGGASQTYSAINGGIDLTGPFFQSMATNRRRLAGFSKVPI